MIQTEFNAQTVFVVNDPPNFISDFQADFSLLLDRQPSLTKREGRRPYCATLRVSAEYLVTLQGPALRQLQGTLRSLTTQPVIIPFWPAISYWGERSEQRIHGGLMLAWKEDFAQFSLYAPGNEPGWPEAIDFCAPALWGFLGRNQPKLLDADTAQWQVKFTESSPAQYALTIIEPAVQTAAILSEQGEPVLSESGQTISPE